MKTTVSQPSRSIWKLLAMAVLVAAPAASDAEPVPTCKAMCQRLTDCKMPSYTKRCLETCKPHEASEEGRAQILAFTRYTCQQIQSAMAGTDGHQTQRSGTADENDDNEWGEAEKQLDRPSRDKGPVRAAGGVGAPARGAPARGAPAHGAPARGAEGSTPIRDNSRRPAAGGSSHSGDNCAPVCGRFEQCRLWRYDSCMSYCSSNTVDPAKNLSAAQWSCPKLGAWMQQLGVSGSSSGSSGGVTCTAEASLGTTQGNMPTIYRTISAMGNGPSRDAASVKALKDCGALVGNAQSLAWLSGEQTEGGNCAISRCTQ